MLRSQRKLSDRCYLVVQIEYAYAVLVLTFKTPENLGVNSHENRSALGFSGDIVRTR